MEMKQRRSRYVATGFTAPDSVGAARSPMGPVTMEGVSQLPGRDHGRDQALPLTYDARLNWILKTIFVYKSSTR